MPSEFKKRALVSNRAPIAATSSIVGFALALVAAVWLTGYRQLQDSHQLMRHETAMKVGNLAVAFEQNVAITASDLDRLLMYLRQMRSRADSETTWQTLVEESYTVADQAVQIAVMDKAGRMITSTAMLYPKAPVDLSDREHFLFHAHSNQDVLFISRPMIGRASGKPSVQFARRLSEADGSFAGVVVISLDPEYVTRTYSKLNLGSGGGLALIGTDGIVRAGTGRYQRMIGSGFREGTHLQSLTSRSPDTRIELEQHGDNRKIVATRRLTSYPLEVVVAIDDVTSSEAWAAAEQAYLVWSIGLSILIISIMSVAVFWQRRAEEALIRLARHDNLTGLANRFKFQTEIAAEMRAVGDGGGFALHLLDLNDFKFVNDTFGHPIGDKLLCAVSDRLVANCRASDLVTRLGGDEFAIIQRNVASDAFAVAFAERICSQLAEPFEVEGKQINIGASIGLALAPTDAKTDSDLINAADIALYCAKTSSSHGVCRYRSEMTETLHDQRELERDLKRALKGNELMLHYQPIVDLQSGKTVGFEALLRWQHSTRGMVSPATFIPIAEQTGCINEIGEWVIRRACEDAASWPSDLQVAINCSPMQFRDGMLPAAIERALSESGLPPSRLEIEITESALMSHDSATLSQLTDISSKGVTLSMDDFGTGYSSLSYLQNYPFSCIKIDRSFVQSLDGTASKIVIITAIVQLATSLGLRTIAEGIETREQLERLRAIGCKGGQGYLFSKPLPVEQAIRAFGPEAEKSHAA